MPAPVALYAFIARVESNAHAEAVAEFSAANSSMQEDNEAPLTCGRCLWTAIWW
jgi:hypothetical protein